MNEASDNTAPPLAFEEAFEILGPALPELPIVLVGGQAVNYWLTYYRRRDASLREMWGVTSDDVDFFGLLDHAAELAKRIKGGTFKELQSPRETISTAIVTFPDKNGVERRIDFLWQVHGIDADEAKRIAIPVELTDRDGAGIGIELRILHPLHCLQSRVANCHDLARYDTDRARRQLVAAINCARAYVIELCDRGDVRPALKYVERYFQIAASPSGVGVFKRWSIDPLAAVPEDARLTEGFLLQRLPRERERIGRLRA